MKKRRKKDSALTRFVESTFFGFSGTKGPVRIAKPKPQQRMSAADYQKTALEKDIQASIIGYLRAHKIPHTTTDASRVWAKDGSVRPSKVDTDHPDISGHFIGTARAFYVETKAAWGKLSPGQKARIKELRNTGAVVIVPKSFEAFKLEFEAYANMESFLCSLSGESADYFRRRFYDVDIKRQTNE